MTPTINRLNKKEFGSTKYTCPNCKREHYIDKLEEVYILTNKEFENQRNIKKFKYPRWKDKQRKELEFLVLENKNLKELTKSQKERIDELETTIEMFIKGT